MRFQAFYLLLLCLCCTPLALAQVNVEVVVKTANNYHIPGAKVVLASANQSRSAVTGDDGRVLFTGLTQDEAYSLTTSHSAYEFDASSGTLSGNLVLSAIGSGGLQTLSGKIIDGELQPIGDAVLVLNGRSQVDVDSTAGTFSLELPYGATYQLEVRHEDMIFFHDSVAGVMQGDSERVFVGYSK